MTDTSKPLVSVAMATYNGGRFVSEQLSSILQQSYKNLEIVICDDASTDTSPEIVRDFASRDSRIKFSQNKRKLGVVKNFEKAIGLCAGEYIALSDQDDIWGEDKIGELVNHIGDNLLIHSDATLIDAEDKMIAESYTEYSRKLVHPQGLVDAVLNGYVTGCTSMFSRRLLNHILPFPEDIYIHDKWICTIAYLRGQVTYLDKPLIRYRQYEGNTLGAEKLEYVNFPDKIAKFGENFQYYRNNAAFKEGMTRQLLFAETVRHYAENSLGFLDKLQLKLLIRYFRSATKKGFKIQAFLIRCLLFGHFEITMPLKGRIFHCLKILFL